VESGRSAICFTTHCFRASRPYDHKELLKDEVFLGILVHTDWDQADAIDFYEALRAELVDIIVAIELEL